MVLQPSRLLVYSASAVHEPALHVNLVIYAKGCISFLQPSSMLVYSASAVHEPALNVDLVRSVQGCIFLLQPVGLFLPSIDRGAYNLFTAIVVYRLLS